MDIDVVPPRFPFRSIAFRVPLIVHCFQFPVPVPLHTPVPPHVPVPHSIKKEVSMISVMNKNSNSRSVKYPSWISEEPDFTHIVCTMMKSSFQFHLTGSCIIRRRADLPDNLSDADFFVEDSKEVRAYLEEELGFKLLDPGCGAQRYGDSSIASIYRYRFGLVWVRHIDVQLIKPEKMAVKISVNNFLIENPEVLSRCRSSKKMERAMWDALMDLFSQRDEDSPEMINLNKDCGNLLREFSSPLKAVPKPPTPNLRIKMYNVLRDLFDDIFLGVSERDLSRHPDVKAIYTFTINYIYSDALPTSVSGNVYVVEILLDLLDRWKKGGVKVCDDTLTIKFAKKWLHDIRCCSQ